MSLLVNSIETFGALDGPGLRTVVFLQRCSLRCKFCHNVECLMVNGGKEYSTDDLFKLIVNNKPYFGEYEEGKEIKGGVTFSGGEPLLQTDELVELFQKLKQEKIHITVDSSLSIPSKYITKLVDLVDYWMVSIKHMDSIQHKNLTGFNNKRILDNILLLDDLLSKSKKQKLRIRFLVVPGITDSDLNIFATTGFVAGLKSLDYVELLAYSSQAKRKWYKLVGRYDLEGVPDADPSLMKIISKKFIGQGIKVIY